MEETGSIEPENEDVSPKNIENIENEIIVIHLQCVCAQMFKTSGYVLLLLSNGDFYFFLPRCDFFINEKEQNFRTVHIINMCWKKRKLFFSIV